MSLIDWILLEAILLSTGLLIFQQAYLSDQRNRIKNLKSMLKAAARQKPVSDKQRAKAIKTYVDYLNYELDKIQALKKKHSLNTSHQSPEELALVMRESFLTAERDALRFPSDSHNYWNNLRASFSDIFKNIRLSMIQESKDSEIQWNQDDAGTEERLNALLEKVEFYKKRITTLEEFRNLFVELEEEYEALKQQYDQALKNSTEQYNQSAPANTEPLVIEQVWEVPVIVENQADTEGDKLRIEALEMELDLARTQINELSAANHEIKQQLSQQTRDYEEIQQEREYLSRELASTQEENISARKTRGIIQDLQAEKDYLQEIIKNNVEESKKMILKINNLEKERKLLMNRLSDNERNYLDKSKFLQAQLNQAQIEKRSLETELNTANIKINKLKAQLRTVDQDLNHLKEKQKDSDFFRQRLQTQAKETHQIMMTITLLENENKKLKDEVSNLQRECQKSVHTRELADQKALLTVREKELAELRKKLANHKDNRSQVVDTYKNLLEEKNQELNKLRAEFTALEKRFLRSKKFP